MNADKILGSPDATPVADRTEVTQCQTAVAKQKRTVYSNLEGMGRDGFALGFSLERIQADANCKERWEREAIEGGFLSARCAAQVFGA